MDNLKITGRIRGKLFRNGVLVKDSGWIQNVITTAGKNALASLLNSTNTGNSLATHIGFGTSTTAVNASDTALGTEISGGGYSRGPVTRSNPTANMIQYVATLTGMTVPTTVQEAGLFNASTSGTLLAHQLTGPFPLNTASDSFQLTWQITIS